MAEASDKIRIECPSCHKRYAAKRTQAGSKVRCHCGFEWTIAIYESPPAPPATPAIATPVGKCVTHPSLDAAFACARCRKLICNTCAFTQADGSRLCPDCATSPAAHAVAAPHGVAFAVPLADGTACTGHPNVPAMRRCSRCNNAICATCDFVFPGGIHLCPTCATTPQTHLTRKQRKLVWWSLGLAIWCTLGLVVLFSGALAEVATGETEMEALGTVIMLLVVSPSLIGLALGIASFERGVKTPTLVWVVTIWNAVIIGILLLLTIVGIAMG